MTPQNFISKISHDVRAPLRALKEMPDWLTADLHELGIALPEHISETTNMMKVQAARLDAMINDLSAWAKLTRTVKTPSTAVNKVLEASIFPETLDQCISIENVPLEHDHATTIVRNLVENAYRHSDIAVPEVRLKLSGDETKISIAVSDNGQGVDETNQTKVFEPLTTLRPRDDVEGSGMGLAIVARIAELYRGTCRMESNKNQGVTVIFEVPKHR